MWVVLVTVTHRSKKSSQLTDSQTTFCSTRLSPERVFTARRYA